MMDTEPLIIGRQQMRTAHADGRARPLTSTITEITRYAGAWWTSSTAGWLRITDTHLAAQLDQIRARLDIEEDEQTCVTSPGSAGKEGST